MKCKSMILSALILSFSCTPHKPVNQDKGIELSYDHNMIVDKDTISLYEDSTGSWMSPLKRGQKIKKLDSIVGADAINYMLVKVATILPVTIEGVTVQANAIKIHGNKAYIAYNYAGDISAGAIQIIDIHDPDNPSILHEVKFGTMDINAMYVDGSKLIFGGQADVEVWGYKSFVAQLDPSDIITDNIINSMKPLSSHAVSGICKHGNNYYVSVGAQNGSIQVLDKNFEASDSLLVDDVRDVDAYQSGIVLIAGTTDNANTSGRVVIATANSFHAPSSISIPNFTSNYHKATIEIYDGTTALLGMSAAGFQVLDLKSNSIVFTCANPESDGITLTNTNSVSSDGNLIFAANGGYGFRVFRPNNKSFTDIKKIGFYTPSIENKNETGYTANQVEFKSNYLFVASGAAGVHVYSLKQK